MLRSTVDAAIRRDAHKSTLITPPFPFSGLVPMVPHILEYLGAMTLRELPDTELEFINGNVNEPRAEEIDAKPVSICTMTVTYCEITKRCTNGRNEAVANLP